MADKKTALQILLEKIREAKGQPEYATQRKNLEKRGQRRKIN